MMPDVIPQETITGFLSQLGFTGFNWEGQPLTLSFEHSGLLHIEPTERGLLLARFQEINEYDMAGVIPKALRAVHADRQWPLPVQAGMRSNNKLAFLVTLAPEQLTIAALAEAMAILDALHQQLTD